MSKACLLFLTARHHYNVAGDNSLPEQQNWEKYLWMCV